MVKLITILLKIYFNIKQEEINIVFYFEILCVGIYVGREDMSQVGHKNQ